MANDHIPPGEVVQITQSSEKDLSFIELMFENQETLTFPVARPTYMVDFSEMTPESLEFIRRYSDGEITVKQVREALGFEATAEEKDLLERIDVKIENFLTEVMDELRPEESDVTSVESDEDYATKDIYLTLPAGTPVSTINNIIDQFASTGRSFTVRVEGWRNR